VTSNYSRGTESTHDRCCSSARLLESSQKSAPMWWLRLVASIKLQVSFAEYSLFHRALFAKETHNLIDPTNRSHPPICVKSVPMCQVTSIQGLTSDWTPVVVQPVPIVTCQLTIGTDF